MLVSIIVRGLVSHTDVGCVVVQNQGKFVGQTLHSSALFRLSLLSSLSLAAGVPEVAQNRGTVDGIITSLHDVLLHACSAVIAMKRLSPHRPQAFLCCLCSPTPCYPRVLCIL